MHHLFGNFFRKWLLAEGSRRGDDAFARCLIRRLPMLIGFLFCPKWAEITRARSGLKG
jgi:hypothetical protein